MKQSKSQTGIGLVEALVAAVIFAIGIGAVVQLQGHFFKESAAANARSIANSLAQEKLEDLRGFQVTDSSDANVFDFTSIGADAGGRCVNNNCGSGLVLPAGNVTADNIAFTRHWASTDYYYNAGALTTTPNGNVVQKQVTVTVTWQDNDGTAQTATISSVINSVASATAAGAVASNVGGTNKKPQVPYTPSTDSRVMPVGVGTSTKRETLVPASQTVGGYTRTKFTAYTYNSSNILVRQEEFQNIACDCTFNGTSDTDNPAYTTAHPEWDATLGTYKDVAGEAVNGKAKGCVSGGGSNCASNPDELCSLCCRDHHDISSATRKYDPYRSSDDFTGAGDHKHYLGTTPVTSGAYLEACRLKRVDGFWQVYQDWHMADLTVLPLSDLLDADTKTTYAGYIKDIVDEYLDESSGATNKTDGQTALSSPPAKPTALDHTLSNNYVAMGVPSTRDLTARAIYLDYIDATHLAAVKAKKGATPQQDYLLHLPFYEIEVAPVANWTSANTSKLLVGPYSSHSASLYGGELSALATNSAAINVTGAMRRSNSGITALLSAVDYNAAINPDSAIHSDQLGVCVGCSTGSCTLPWGGALANNGTVTAYQAATVPHGQACTSQIRTCTNGVLSGSYAYEGCTVLPANGCITPWGANVNNGVHVTAYNQSVVVQPDTCANHSISMECEEGHWENSNPAYIYATCSVSQCSSTVTGSVKNNKEYWLSINGGVAIACPVVGSTYRCPTQTVNISGTTLVITELPGNGTRTVTSPSVCGSITANF